MAPCGFPVGGTGPGGLVHRCMMVVPKILELLVPGGGGVSLPRGL